MKARSALLDATSRVAWSHWTALGVAGVVPPPDTAVDPESLLVLTAALRDVDPRLMDEAIDWCIRYARRFVSLTRLRNLRQRAPEDEIQGALDELTAIVNQQGGTRWPTSAQPRRYSPSGKSRLEKLDHPAHAVLRLRCVLGISARVEILHTLLTTHSQSHWMKAAAFTELGYGKRNLAEILDDLSLGGVVVVRRIDNSNGYRLSDASLLRKLLAPIALRSGRWHLRLPLLARCAVHERRTAGKDPLVRSVEIKRLLDEIKPTLALLELEPPAPTDPKRYADEIAAWLVEHVIAAP